jgi:hypothetical protein
MRKLLSVLAICLATTSVSFAFTAIEMAQESALRTKQLTSEKEAVQTSESQVVSGQQSVFQQKCKAILERSGKQVAKMNGCAVTGGEAVPGRSLPARTVVEQIRSLR